MSSRQKRMTTLLRRIESVQLPAVTEVCMQYVTADVTPELVRDLENRIFFSEFPEEDVSLSLSTLSMNAVNLDSMKKNGSLGVILELLRRIPEGSDLKSQHVADIVRSLNILTEDVSVQKKLLSNVYALPCILSLCRRTTDDIQAQLVQVIDRLSKTKNGIHELVQNSFFKHFISEEMLVRKTTSQIVKHTAAAIINRTAVLRPECFLFNDFQDVCYKGLVRNIDGFTETQILEAALCHLSWLAGEGKELDNICVIMEYLIDEVKKEAFEDVNHVKLYYLNYSYLIIFSYTKF